MLWTHGQGPVVSAWTLMNSVNSRLSISSHSGAQQEQKPFWPVQRGHREQKSADSPVSLFHVLQIVLIEFKGLFVCIENISAIHLFSCVAKLMWMSETSSLRNGGLNNFIIILINLRTYKCEDTEGTFVLLSLLGSFIFHISKQVHAFMKVPPFIASPLQCGNGLGSLC